MNRKLLLVNPRVSEGGKYPPQSLIWLAAYIEKHSYDVEITDAHALEMRDEDLIEHIVQSGASFCGFTFMTAQADYVTGIIKKVKQIQPKIILLAGGVHVSTVPEDFLIKCPEVDYIIVGEGEVTLLELMEFVIQGKDTENIQGIAFARRQNIKINPRRALLSNLDELPMPAWSKLPIHKYDVVIPERDRMARPGECVSISSERGCPFQCTFCASGAVYGKTCRSRSPYKTFEELQYLAKNHGVYKFFFADEALLLKEGTMLELCDLINKSGLSISWSCNSRCSAPGFTEKALSAMKKAGCARIGFGVESGSPKVLKSIRKGITLKDIYRVHKMVHDAGMITTTLMMFGQPDETIEDFKMSLRMLLYLEGEVNPMGPATPFPGTELYTYAVKHNYLRVAKNDWKEFYIGNIMNHIMRTEHFDYDEMVDIALYGNGVGDIFAKLSNYKWHGKVTFLNTLKLYVSVLLDVISWLPLEHKALWIKMFLLKRSKPEYVKNIINITPIVVKEIRSYDFSLYWDGVCGMLPPREKNTMKCMVFAGTSLGLTDLLNHLQDKYGKNLQVTVACNDDNVKLPQEFVTKAKRGDVFKGDFKAVFYLDNRSGFYVLFNIGLRAFYYRLFCKNPVQFIVYPKMRFWEINIGNVLIALTGIKNRNKAVRNLLSLPEKLVYLMYLTLTTKEIRFKEIIIPPEAQ